MHAVEADLPVSIVAQTEHGRNCCMFAVATRCSCLVIVGGLICFARARYNVASELRLHIKGPVHVATHHKLCAWSCVIHSDSYVIQLPKRASCVQEAPAMTEDMLLERQAALAALGNPLIPSPYPLPQQTPNP